MKAIVVMDQTAGTAGMELTERPTPQAAINDVIIQVHASGFVPTELTWPSTWTDRVGRRAPRRCGRHVQFDQAAVGETRHSRAPVSRRRLRIAPAAKARYAHSLATAADTCTLSISKH